MKQISTEKELKAALTAVQKSKKSMGFVPTMGALHHGHISLIEACKKQCDITIVSIFVNPTQFNDKKDFERYPRTIEKDLALLKKAGVDLVFLPDEKLIYPKPDKRKFNFGKLDQVLEGKHRPGHFNGVAQVVSRLLELIKPDKLFLGQKDYQQVMIIRELIRQLKRPAKVIVCPTVRDEDNLAMSSRNALLSDEEYDEATFIPLWMEEVKKLAARYKVSQIKTRIETLVSQREMMKLDYFEICNSETLEPIKEFADADRPIALIAVYVGRIRLIDNLLL
jgi:pantoate--beta-alanine ligase